ncbi:nucleoside-diphosphate sugar epimerase/dehydratase [Pseudorhodoferax sp. Leaf274]|uniref:polysaccharide biosynthesis protein n=1 Tax=Pseudorhodoferax sp. Leaf274 TaxID=1736318 RepID=UPI0007035D63|nr:nucleoside-diphosphate sugar epimerase/dehydratase [Pseudorhodoferax sp. Leaf274]KQP35804.1 capsular biosynthesis protein [Pseudorhodoferax sp. Leaf274]
MPAARASSAVLGWPRAVKRAVVVATDVLLSLAATWLAFTLRLDTLHWPEQDQWAVYTVAPLLSVPVFVRFGLYRAIFRYTGVATLLATAKAIALYALMLLAALAVMQNAGLSVVPRSLGILQPLIFLLLVLASRTLARAWLDGQARRGLRAPRRLMVYGAGQAGAEAAAALLNGQQPYRLLGFIDDDAAKVGRSIHGVRVFAPRELPTLVARLHVQDILLAIPSAARERRNQILNSLQPLPVHVRTLPSLADLASGRVSVQDIHELDIEDLLGREPVPPRPELLARNLAGRTVLITGAGGSIGGELCRQILRERPARLVLLDHSEFALYSIHEELQGLAARLGSSVELVPVLGSVVHYARLAALFQRWQPTTVYHAAAYKHVPLVEVNAAEGVMNNVLGTLNLARAAIAGGAEHFVLISTDKAVRPTNVMGASKRVAELILQALAAETQVDFEALADAGAETRTNHTRFSMVRFGNVLGSSGSVVPLFRRQLAAGGPLTVTHAEVTRYFMTIAEAAQLVLQAGAMAQGGDVFVLDMGQPVKILDLAMRMIDLSGLRVRDAGHPEGDIAVTVTGLRPGEKLYEELLIGNDPEPTEHPRILRAQEEHLTWAALAPPLRELTTAARHGESGRMLNLLQQLVPGFKTDGVLCASAMP